MSNILIDNSTISSVLRAIGWAPMGEKIDEPLLIDIEQAALERFSEAVLLSDKIIIPDNYKTEYREERKQLLSEDFIEHAEINRETDEQLSQIAKSFSEIWLQSFQAGSEQEHFPQYLTLAFSFSKYLWDRSDSFTYLVFSAFGIDKSSPLFEALNNNVDIFNLSEDLPIIDSSGNAIDFDLLSFHAKNMLSIVAWMSRQYIWHQVLSARNDSYYIPHPLREFFAYDFLNRLQDGFTSRIAFAKAFDTSMGRFKADINDALLNLGLGSHSQTIPMPTFLPLIASECSNGSEVLPFLFHLRNESMVRELREAFIEAEKDSEKGDFGALSRIKEEIQKIGLNILRRRGLRKEHIHIKPPLKFFGITVSGDETGIPILIPDVLYKDYFLTRRYRCFLRSVMEELAIPSKLGKMKDKLDSFVGSFKLF